MFSDGAGYVKTGYDEIQPNGNFVLVNDVGTVFWSKAFSSDGAYMWLRDNGNLMILNKDGSTILWQTNKLGSC
jgi:hypothetical protein